MRDTPVAVELRHAEVAQVFQVGLTREHHPRPAGLHCEGVDAGPQRSLENVVREKHHAAVAGHELLGEAERLRDPAGLLLVGVEEAIDAELVSVAEQS
jgi:hypothetical protein